MPPKPFSMDSVLKYRKQEEGLAQEQFVRAALAVESAQTALRTAREKLQFLVRSLEKNQTKGMAVAELSRYETRIQYEQEHLKELHSIVVRKKNIAQNKQKKLVQKVKEHKILTTLKDQQNKLWKEFIEKKEAAMLDEIAILHHGRKIN